MKRRLFATLCCVMVALAVKVSADAPKYIFYFIGDGMGMSPVLAAENYNRYVLGNTDEHIMMMQFPVASQVTTYSYAHSITDSAAAGTALATGSKTRNSMIGVNQDSVPVNSIATDLKAKGYGVAIATSVPLDDATPAVFYAHQINRGMQYEIGKDIINSGFDFFVGSVLRALPHNDWKLRKEIEAGGYTFAFGAKDYEAKKHLKKLILLNTADTKQQHFGYTIDSIKENLNLPYITKACIEQMQAVSPKKFFMMVEGGNIDWAAHANDAGAMIKEVMNFNEAIKLAYDFYLQHPKETLIVVTADHNTGGFSFGRDWGTYNPVLKNYDYQRISLQAMQADIEARLKAGEEFTWEKMQTYLTEKLGFYKNVKISDLDNVALYESFKKTYEKKEGENVKTLYASYSQFVNTVFKVLDSSTGVAWTTHGHTGDMVPLYAVGVGCERFTGVVNNTDIAKIMRELTGVKK